MASNITETDYDASYDYSGFINDKEEKEFFLNSIRTLYMAAYVVSCTLGLTLNLYVICVGCYVKSAASMWVLALAVTHLVFSAFLVLQLLYAWHFFSWQCGVALCKVSSFIFYASMFATASLLSMWSTGTCFEGCSEILIAISWTLAAALSSPSLLFRGLRHTEHGLQCMDDYNEPDSMHPITESISNTGDGQTKVILVMLSRFLLGILVPMLVMVVSACVTPRRAHGPTFRKVIVAIKVAHFVCWTPLVLLGLVQVTMESPPVFMYVLPAATALAAAQCFINPVIYLLVGAQINMRWMSQVPEISGPE